MGTQGILFLLLIPRKAVVDVGTTETASRGGTPTTGTGGAIAATISTGILRNTLLGDTLLRRNSGVARLGWGGERLGAFLPSAGWSGSCG